VSLNTVLEPETDGVDKGEQRGHGSNPGPKKARRQPRPKEGRMTTLPKPILVDDLETPLLVRRMLDRLKAAPPDDLRGLERELKLSYYYEGLCVAVRDTANGPEVLASGEGKEIFAVLKDLPKGTSELSRVIDPTPLSEFAAQLPRSAETKVR
jgi:hypothetical protein